MGEFSFISKKFISLINCHQVDVLVGELLELGQVKDKSLLFDLYKKIFKEIDCLVREPS